MAMPTFVAVGTAVASTGTAVTPGLPAGWQENDIFLLFGESSNQVYNTPTGWTFLDLQSVVPASTLTTTRVTIFWRRATSSESDPSVDGPANHIWCRIAAFRGCITTGNPWDIKWKNSDDVEDTSLVAGGATTAVNDTLIALFVARGNDAGGAHFDSWANSDLANITEHSDGGTANGNGGGIGFITGEKATAGSFGNTTATLAVASAKAWVGVALKGVSSVEHSAGFGGSGGLLLPSTGAVSYGISE